AVRVGKLTIAALRATLKLYLDGEYNKVPVLRMIYEEPVEVKRRAVSLHRRLRLKGAKVLRTSAVIGGGSAPSKTIPSFGLSIVSSLPNKLHERLRSLSPPVLARIDGNTLIFDMKAVSDSEIALLADKIKEALCDVV
ncbi:MAG TPA: L-seryl-tRNA(Sec) selenium transferase, partial [Deltaproteobacteria bacterium]|nr:L-seryl-tRNA(Sec) selenium transferase [Deltaproteobacteria bacterium]